MFYYRRYLAILLHNLFKIPDIVFFLIGEMVFIQSVGIIYKIDYISNTSFVETIKEIFIVRKQLFFFQLYIAFPTLFYKVCRIRLISCKHLKLVIGSDHKIENIIISQSS